MAFCLFKHIDFSGKKSTESVPNTVYIAVYTGSCMALFTSTQLTPHVGGKFLYHTEEGLTVCITVRNENDMLS